MAWLESLALKSKLIRQFEVLENLEYFYGKLCYFEAFDMLFPFLAFLKLQLIILWKVSRSRDGLAAKGLYQYWARNE